MVSVLARENPVTAKPFLGAMLIMIAVFMWPLADAMTKLLYSENALTLIFYVVFFRGVVSYLAGTGLSHDEGQYVPISKIRHHPDIQIGLWRGASGAMVNIMLLIGLQYICITKSATILFMAPFIAILLIPFVLGEQFKSANILTLGTAILGLMVATDPNHVTETELYGMGSSLVAAIFMAIFSLINYKHPKYNAYLAMRTSGFCYMVFALIGLIFANSMGYTQSYMVDFTAFTWQQNLMFLGAVLLNFGGSVIVQKGFQYTPAILAALIAYTELFWVVGIEHILFSGMEKAADLAGLVLIATAGVVSVYFNNSKDA